MWGNLKFWHGHDKFHNFTKSLKSLILGSREYFSQNFTILKQIKLINPTQCYHLREKCV